MSIARRRLALATSLALTVGFAAPLLGEPPAPPTSPTAPAPAGGTEQSAPRDGDREPARGRMDQAKARERLGFLLDRRLSNLDRERTDLVAAIAKFKSGATVREIFSEHPIARRLMEQARINDEREMQPGGPGVGGGPGERQPRMGNDGPDRPRPRDGAPGAGGLERGGFDGQPDDPLARLQELVHDPDAERVAPLDRAVTADEKKEINDFLTQAMPPLKDQLARLEEHDADAAAERYRQIYPKLARARALKAEDAELYNLVLEGLSIRRKSIEAARVLAGGDASSDKPEQAALKRQELRTLIDRGLTVADQVRDKMQARRMKDREKFVNSLADLMIDRERLRGAPSPRPDKGDGPPPDRREGGRPGPDGPGDPDGPGGPRRPRPRGGSGDGQGPSGPGGDRPPPPPGRNP